MAYGLKYTTYKAVGDTRYTLRIYQKDYNGASFGIGTLTGFSLQIQGDQSSLIAPIIKTSVNISLKDFFNRGTTQSGVTCIEDGEKMGQWEEFYTRDPLKYRIDVLVGASNPTTIWSGYLTPDSWGEEMQYGGDINLTARDMIGYLDEQEFDLTGRTTIQNLIQAAINKSQSSMAVSFKTTDCLYNTNGQSILAATIDASTYSGNTWYQALEKCLESLGLVLRYNGDGGFFVTSLRYLALHTHEYSTAMFTGRSGYRTLDPAVKQIVETFDPKWVNFDVPDAEADNVSQASGTWTCRHYWVQWHEYSVQKYQITGDTNWTGYAASLPNRTPYKNALKRNIYLPFNTTTDVGLVFRRNGFIPPCKVVLSLSAPHHATASTIINDGDGIKSLPETSVDAVISVVVGNTTYYLTQDYIWDNQSSHSVNIKPDAAEIELPSIGDGAASDFRITFNRANMADWEGGVNAPFYMAVDVEFQPIEGKSTIAGEYKTTTIYNENNHTEISREPSVGAATGSTNIDFVPNLLAYGYSIATDAWKFYGDANTFPLAVMIHAQIIVYYGQMEDSQGRETGNSIFTGNFIDSQQTPLVPATRYTYFGKTCTLLSGAYNFLTGGVDSATLREFFTWSSVWDTFDPTYSVKTSRNEGGTASAGGGGSASSGGGSTGGSVTSVDMSVPTGMTIGGNPITTRGTLALGLAAGYNFLTDTYKATLDGHLGSSSNPHNVTWAQVNSASGDNKIVTAYIGDGQVTLAKLAQGIQDILDLFEKDTTSVAGQTLIHAKYALYSHEEITAGGIGSGGGGGGAAIWGAITGTLSNQTDLMAALNGKASASHTHTIGNITGLQDALDAKQALITSSNKLAYSLISGTPDLSVYATTSALSAHTGDTTIHITASERSTWNGKQDAISDLSTIRTRADEGHTAYGWGNHANAGYLTTSTAASTYLPLSGGTIRRNVDAPLGIVGIDSGAWIQYFAPGGTSFGYIGVTTDGPSFYDTARRVIYHSGNLSSSVIAGLGTLSNSTTGNAATSTTATNVSGGYCSLDNNETDWNFGVTQNRITPIFTFDGSATGSPGMYHYGYSFMTAYSGFQLVEYGSGNIFKIRGNFDGTWQSWHTLYHSGNCNNTSTPWSASSLTLNGSISGATKITTTGYIVVKGNVGYYHYDSSSNFLCYFGYDTTGFTQIYHKNANYIRLHNNTNIELGGGNVGIGTTSPSYKLDVNGSFHQIGDYSSLTMTGGRGSYHFNLVGEECDCGVARIIHRSITGSGSAGTYSATLALIDERVNNLSGTYEPTFFINRTGATTTPALMEVRLRGTDCFSIDNYGSTYVKSLYAGNTSAVNHTYIRTSSNTNSSDVWALKVIQGADCGSGTYDTVIITGTDVTSLRLSESDGSQLGICAGDGNGTFISTNNFRFYTGCAANYPIYNGSNGTLRMILNYSGYSVYMSGSSYCYGDFAASGEVTAGSDLRWKSNISELTDYKSILRALNPVEWDWKEGHGNGHSCGFIAQDIKDIMPYAVKGNEKDGYTLNYNTFHAVWATALRNHETRVEYLERRVKELENRIAQLS